MEPSLPSEAYQLAEQYRLGNPLTMYTFSTGMAVFFASLIFVPLLFVLWGIGELTYVFYGIMFKYSLWFGIFLIFPILGCTVSFVLLNQVIKLLSGIFLHIRTYFCETGLVYIEGKKIIVILWKQIAHVEMHKKVSRWLRISEVTFAVLLKDGGEVVLNSRLGGNWKEVINSQLRRYNKQKPNA